MPGKSILTAKPKDKPYKLSDGGGLYLLVNPTGARYWRFNEKAVIAIVAQTIWEGLDNGRIIAERLNEAGYQTKAGKAWDKDIYSA